MFFGTTVTLPVVRAVDGDTVRIDSGGRQESVRLLALDTEESNRGSNKPVTPWGREAKAEAQRLLQPGDAVTLEFPGTEPLEECWGKHRDNYGRVLGFIHKDGMDLQEHMIREAYSPYFVKYGYAEFAAYHQRYTAAERDAQAAGRGLWDQVAVNGSEQRNYALLGVWWHLRAQAVDQYRQLKQSGADLLEARQDYARLLELAAQRQEVTVFTELREYHQVGSRHVVVTIGSIEQPFQVFIPNAVESGQAILELLDNRYIAVEEDHLRRSYAYVRGPLKLFGDRPEITVESPDQITDWPSS